LVPEEFGFRKDITIEKAIFALTSSILTALDQRKQIGSIFCDLTKAFDCVNHEIILRKLCHYGIRGTCAQWFRSYLVNRRQKVGISPRNQHDESFSNWEIVKNGVPQGSILGPVLFIIYINDLSYGFKHWAIPVLYADETSVLIMVNTINELQTKFNSTLNYMNTWFTANGLSLNTEKTNIVNSAQSFTR
jgi:hypothetical protein